MAGRVCFFGWVLPGEVNLGLAMDALDSRAVVCTGDQIPCECECAFAPWISKRKEVLHLGVSCPRRASRDQLRYDEVKSSCLSASFVQNNPKYNIHGME